MNVSSPFIIRPIATTLLMVAVVLVGLLGYRMLPVAALPTVDFPSIQVVTTYPGASPDVMQSSVSAPLEYQLARIPGLTLMTSTSSYGTSQITLQFSLSRDIASAGQDVQAAINAATGWLPVSALPSPPIYRKVNPADMPVLVLALTSETMSLHAITEYAATAFVPKLSQIDGVGQVSIQGGQARAVRLEANPRKLAALGLSLFDVRKAIEATTVDVPKGQIDGAHQAFEVGNNDQLFAAREFLNAVVAYRNGAPVLFKDVGEAVEGLENEKLAGWYNGEPAVIINVQRQPGANIIKVADAVQKLLPEIEKSSPRELKFAVAADRTTTIRAAVLDVQKTLAITVALVVLVIFLFLRKFWATIIPSVTLPVSLIATFAIMAVAGFSFDNLSLMALAVASGFIVDDAIVMIENIVRYIEAGDRPLDAALKGSRQIGFTIVSLTVSLVAVFIPLLLMGGLVGRLFREFAITLSASIVVSGLVSLVLTPMMCAMLLKREEPGNQTRLFQLSERAFDAMRGLYEAGLRWTLQHQTMMLVVTILTFFASIWLYMVIPKGFVPEQDTGLIAGVTDAAQDISFDGMSALQQKVADIVAKDPDVIGVTSFVGVDTENPTLNSGRLYIDIGSPDRRRASAAQIMDRLGAAVAGLHDITLHLQPVQDIQIETRQTRTQYQYVLQDIDDKELRRWADRFVEELRKQRDLADVTTDQQDLGQQIMITVNRQAAARYGVNMASIDEVLYAAFGQQQIATIYTPVYQYHVILEVAPEYRNTLDALGSIYVTPAGAIVATRSQAATGVTADFGTMGKPISLASFAEIHKRLTPLVITHQGQFPAITLSFNLPSGVSLGQALETLRRTEHAIGLPRAVETNLAGKAAEFASSLESEPILIAAAIIAVYIVLGILYESYIHPITILSTLPSAGVGALLALMLFRQDLNLVSLIGIILLIGIVKKNGIMMVDFALAAERQEGLSPRESIYQACLLRFRPIMMTTMAALLGALPLALGTGTGSELRRPLGIAVVGGLLVSQFLTLYTTPVIYLAFARVERHFSRKRSDQTMAPIGDGPPLSREAAPAGAGEALSTSEKARLLEEAKA
jgi:hydrophobe/amphiphile efflux-1 (HAE1) family protein